MISVVLTDPILLSLTLDQLAPSGLFPQAIIYDDADSVVATRNLTEVAATGRYTDSGFVPGAIGTFHAHFIVYTDAGHSIESALYSRAEESYFVTETLDSIIDGAITWREVLLRGLAWFSGRVVRDPISPGVVDLEYYEQDGTTIAFENRKTDTERQVQ